MNVPAENPEPDAMPIWKIYVRKEFIGQGSGAQLIDWAEAQFLSRGVNEVYISVFSENSRTISFYQRYGFEKVGEYGFEVGNHVDLEWIMRERR
ncbi:GNAT family N-acetyltransferase [Akkermansiaceae bacterium]|nr:GNAT family N-acetyltransferase [Akkermansiaceae bacterium]MDB4283008.1 GNAT family N-acetyltransferase [Akkermansiaceae bacterium]MDB4667924.1 GNAT family N-acetyltransferase [Akkermansiaceae bacterium]